MPDSLSPDLLRKMHAYWRAANYLSVGQIYLQDNPLLESPLRLEHIKPRLLGHWGTTPGLNFLYVHLNRLIKDNDLNMMYVIGPGHGGPGLVAQTYLEIANPMLARISRQELTELLRGYGYDPHFVEGNDPAVVHQCLAGTLDAILAQIRQIQSAARSRGETETLERPRWPMIIFRTPKGWTGLKIV